MLYLFFLAAAGFLTFLISAVSSKKIFLLKAGDKCYHIHHWMTLMPLALILVAIGARSRPEYKPYLFGTAAFCVGGSATNFLYPDWDEVRSSCDVEEECVVPLEGKWLGDAMSNFC